MPLIQPTSLAALFDPKPMEKSATRMAKAVGDLLHDEVVKRTPVADLPPGVTAEMRGRVPGTLKASWKTSAVEGGGKLKPLNKAQVDKRAVEEYTLDPIGPLVEWPTKPHIIKPRIDRAPASVVATGKPRGTVQQGNAALRYVNRFGRVVYAKEVHHPGTQGVHMMRDALAEVDASWVSRVGHDETERWAREQLRGLR